MSGELQRVYIRKVDRSDTGGGKRADGETEVSAFWAGRWKRAPGLPCSMHGHFCTMTLVGEARGCSGGEGVDVAAASSSAELVTVRRQPAAAEAPAREAEGIAVIVAHVCVSSRRNLRELRQHGPFYSFFLIYYARPAGST